jgi:peptidoglycan/LPS O-acetylase OafA/YrhL
MNTEFDQRANNFDFIRMALALLVIFSHCYLVATGSEATDPFNILTRHQVTGGHIAVDLFFIISGFLITASFERSPSILQYLERRIGRIYPGFFALMIVSALFFLPLAGGRLAGSTWAAQTVNVITHALRLRDFDADQGFAGNPYPAFMNASLWSISYEFWCYIGVVVLGVSGLLRSWSKLVGILLLSIVVSVLFCVYAWQPGGSLVHVFERIFGLPFSWARLIPMFLAGVVFYKLRAHLSLKASWIAIACALLVAGAFVNHLWIILFPVVGGYLVLALAFHPALRLHRWARYGDFSYGTYLYAFPVQQLVMQMMQKSGHPVPAWKLFLVAAPLTLLCAAISWHGVEKWFLRAREATQPAADYSMAPFKTAQR